MPKLVLFAPCEKAIIEQGSNTFSLISILQDLNVPIPAGQTVPKDAFGFQRWYIVALWHRESGDEGKRFQQRVTVTDPNGQVPLESVAEFEMAKRFHRAIIKVDGFPVSVPGDHSLGIAIREVKQDEWIQIASFPLRVIHQETLKSQLP